MSYETGFTKLRDFESADDFDGGEKDSNEYLLPRGQKTNSPRLYQDWKCSALLCLNVILFLMTLTLFTASRPSSQRNYALRQVSEYSPIFDKIDIGMSLKKMNATLLEPEPPTIYRQPPSPEVDEAWARITSVRPIAITKDEVVNLGKDPSQAAKWPESFGFGSDAYIGRVDVFHQIHCLDALRREAYFDHYYGKKWPDHNTSELHRVHLSHCIHLLLQNLMCQANVGVYTHIWVDANYNAFPDFSLNHKCRDFESILRWQEENSVSVAEFVDIRKPPDYKVHVMTHKFKELFGWFLDHEDDGSAGGEIG